MPLEVSRGNYERHRAARNSKRHVFNFERLEERYWMTLNQFTSKSPKVLFFVAQPGFFVVNDSANIKACQSIQKLCHFKEENISTHFLNAL